MATMNKPASNDRDWSQAVTDNWSSIENNLIDKSIVTAKGDLIVATALGTPARLGVGADGKYLMADGSQASGVQWSDSNTLMSQDAIDISWGKKFFQDAGFLPSTKIFEYTGTPPAFAGTSGAAAWTRETGDARPNNTGWAYYDLGAAYSKILVVCGSVFKLGSFAVELSASPPAGAEPNGYQMWNDSNGPGIWKYNSGWTRLDTSTGFGSVDYMSGYALYWDGGTGTLKMFLRMGGQWMLAESATDVTFTTMRYVSFEQYAASNNRWITPLVCYAQ